MCGIMGVVGRRVERDWNSWAAITAHRGPDSSHVWSDEHALLGHNRLAIIDLSTAADQPMVGDNGRCVIVFNGEIFNFEDLRGELSREGVRFRTRSDTEVLLAGYERWGAGRLLQKLDGMFAFAIWEREERRLFAARDHVGIKPFFYHHGEGSFVFGSELKLLLALRDREPVLRRASVYEYLLFSYVPAPYTPYSGYFKLPAGHYLEYDQRADRLVISKWWQVPKPTRTSADYDGCVQQLRTIFHTSVRRRMISDVPLGAFLSGGIDSSVIVAEMASLTRKVKTFSIGYRDNPDYDESAYADLMARELGVEHVTLYPHWDSGDITHYLELITRHFDEPYGNPTVALTYLLTKTCREQVKVALVGDGGDELFAGYPRHYALLWARRLRSYLGPAASLILAFLRTLPETPDGNHRVRRVRRFFASLQKPLAVAFQDWVSLFPLDVLLSLLPQGVAMPDEVRRSLVADWYAGAQADAVASGGYADLNTFLPYNLLEGADRMSMANGFELRVPFVAREIIEFASGVPSAWKIRGGEQKRILKDAYRDVLPPVILKRKKRGFNPPVWHWLQENRTYVQGKLSAKSPIVAFVSGAALERLVADFFARRADHSTQLWSLLVLQHWLENSAAKGIGECPREPAFHGA